MLDPAELITQYFPDAPFNFEQQPPDGTPNDPLTAIYTMVAQYLQVFASDAQVLGSQLTVQNAEGVYLAAHGIFYGLTKNPGESDSAFRVRILAAINQEKLTLSAIHDAVLAYYTDQFNNGNIPGIPQVYVFDIQSDPTLSGEYGIVRLDICVRLVFQSPPFDSQAWFLNRSFIGRDSFLLAEFVITNSIHNARLDQILTTTRAAGTNLLYALLRAYHQFGQMTLPSSMTTSAKVTANLKSTFCIFDPKQVRMYLTRGANHTGAAGTYTQYGGFLSRDAFLYSPCPPVLHLQ